MDNVCNRCLFSIPSKVEMAEEQEYLQGCPWSLVSYSHFSTDRAQYQGKSVMFFNVRVHEGALIDAINYAQKGCAMQM